MRSAARKHLSVIEGRAQFAVVTVAELPESDAKGVFARPVLILNDREMQNASADYDKLIEAAISGLKETEKRLEWRGLPLRVTRVESSYVDAHPDAVRKAAIDAAVALIRGEQ
jgi:hypothetical protein